MVEVVDWVGVVIAVMVGKSVGTGVLLVVGVDVVAPTLAALG